MGLLCTSVNEGATLKRAADSQSTAKAAVQYCLARPALLMVPACEAGETVMVDCCCESCTVACEWDGTSCLKPPCDPPLLWLNTRTEWWETGNL